MEIFKKKVLVHSKLKAFITHAGQNSVNEIAQAGIPVIAIPLMFDQPYNSARFVESKIGVVLDITKLPNNSNYLINALNEVLNNESYKKNAKILMKKFNTSPFKPKEKFVRWIEFASQFPELNELNLPIPEEMGLISFYNIDVLVVIILLIILILIFIVLILKVIFKIMKRFVLKKFKLD